MSDLCREFGISRKTGHKIFNRYKEEGVFSLCGRSAMPTSFPARSSIGALLGHKDVSTTQRYAHVANDTARQAADEVAGVVAVAMGMSVARDTRLEEDDVQEAAPAAPAYTLH